MTSADNHSNGTIAAAAAGDSDTDADPDPPERRNICREAGACHG